MLVTNFWVKYSLYKLVMPLFQLFDTGHMHPLRAVQLRALNRSVDYLEAHMQKAIGLDNQKELLEYTLDQVEVEGYYLEFGVFTGGTMRRMARRKRQAEFHGFDSFEGLPEAWSGFTLGKGAFSLGGKLPMVPRNVQLHKGWFNQSLPKWLEEHPGKVAFIHVDCDLYSSTVDIFENLAKRLHTGTVVLFDEYFNYAHWEHHVFKAWKEFVAKHNVSYEYLGYARQQVAVKITSINPAT